jgi:polyhydroxyalkanoate synthesis regulator protein
MEANMASPQESNPTLIKRYGRNRLYDVVQSRYVTIEELHQWVTQRKSSVVVDCETGADVTRILLA